MLVNNDWGWRWGWDGDGDGDGDGNGDDFNINVACTTMSVAELVHFAVGKCSDVGVYVSNHTINEVC